MSNDECMRLLIATRLIMTFANETMEGNSYWVDLEGERHVADCGYAWEYLEDLKNYLQKKVRAVDE